MDQNHEDYDQNGKGENPPRGADPGRVRWVGDRVRGGGGTGGLAACRLGRGCWPHVMKKEICPMGRAGEKKKIWPKAIFRVKTFCISQTIFQFANHFGIQIKF
jgi:hypothetical protein